MLKALKEAPDLVYDGFQYELKHHPLLMAWMVVVFGFALYAIAVTTHPLVTTVALIAIGLELLGILALCYVAGKDNIL